MNEPCQFEYERKVLLLRPDIEVVEITWPPGIKSPPHDHGKSHGLVRVLKGQIFQEIYDKSTRRFLRQERFQTGESFIETPDIIHIMGNESKQEPAITIHCYMPPLKMNVYDEVDLPTP